MDYNTLSVALGVFAILTMLGYFLSILIINRHSNRVNPNTSRALFYNSITTIIVVVVAATFFLYNLYFSPKTDNTLFLVEKKTKQLLRETDAKLDSLEKIFIERDSALRKSERLLKQKFNRLREKEAKLDSLERVFVMKDSALYRSEAALALKFDRLREKQLKLDSLNQLIIVREKAILKEKMAISKSEINYKKMEKAKERTADSLRIAKGRDASIIKAEEELIASGATRKEIQELHIARNKSKLKQKLEQRPDEYQSMLYVLHSKQMKKWKSYDVIGDLRSIIGNNSLEITKQMEALQPEGYSMSIQEKLPVPNLVRLKLNGTMFKINPTSEEWQSIESVYACKWLWEVIPNERDKEAKLYFTLEGKNNAGEVYPICAFSESVKVSGGYGKDMAKHWQWVIVTIVAPLTGWLAGAGRWRRVLAYLKGLLKKKKVVKVEEVQKEEAKEG